MVQAIGGSGGSLISLYTERMRSRLSPDERFKQMDTDGSGSLSKTELETVLTDMTAKTGATLSVDDSMVTYDADNDALLNQSEMDGLMRAVMEQYGPPEASTTIEQAIGAYMENSESDQLSALMENLATRKMEGPPPPPPNPEDKFDELDTDGDGNLNASELKVLAEEMAERTGSSFDAAEAVGEYDADGDDLLSLDEMDNMMNELREALGPPPRMESGSSMQEVVASYLEGADSDEVATLIEILSNYAAKNGGKSGGLDTSA